MNYIINPVNLKHNVEVNFKFKVVWISAKCHSCEPLNSASTHDLNTESGLHFQTLTPWQYFC